MDHRELEEGAALALDFTKLGKVAASGAAVVATVVQNAETKEVLIIAYVNEAALQASLSTRIATFWSTSRNELWVKGATSGDYLELVEVRVNCEQNSLLYLVRPKRGGVCHTKDAAGNARPGCFYRVLTAEGLRPATTK